LQNVSNSFSALANKQYVERRVEEEEPQIAREEVVAMSKESAAVNDQIFLNK
jgi:hypothetical protein